MRNLIRQIVILVLVTITVSSCVTSSYVPTQTSQDGKEYIETNYGDKIEVNKREQEQLKRMIFPTYF